MLNSREEASTGPAGQLTETELEADRQTAEAREPAPVQPAEPVRPPTSGPGSGADAWRRYAAQVTDSPVDQWAGLSRDEIIELLDDPEVSDDDDTLPA